MNHLEPDLSSTSLSRNASFMQNSSAHTILSFLLFYFPLSNCVLKSKCILDEILLWTWFSSVQSLSHVWLFVTPWIAARQASLSIASSWSSLRLTSIESVMSSSHLILCRPLLLLPPIPPSIRVFMVFFKFHFCPLNLGDLGQVTELL